jgi:3'-5' exoribonuclease
MPRIPVAQFRLNLTLRKQLFLLREKSIISTRNGSTMLRVLLADRSGVIYGVLFDAPTHVADALAIGQGVEVDGRVSEFREQLQINLDRIGKADITDLTEFLPMARRPLGEMKDELDALRASIAHPQLSMLLDAILDDPVTFAAYTKSPAAKFNHHACVGGLLEHTLSVTRIVLAACEIYPELDHDVVLTAALLHDLGKLRAYDPISFELTEEGALWTHLYVGASQIEHAIDALPEFDPELRLRIVHAILAHHGKLEHGSPVRPMTLEAIVLHYADNLDGDARGAIDYLDRNEADNSRFTDVSSMHDTKLYRGSDGQGSAASPAQGQLW